MSYFATLQRLGYTLEKAPLVLAEGRFVAAVQHGNLVYTSGSVSRFGGVEIKGFVGADLTIEDGYEACKLSTLNALQAIHSLVGIDNVVRIFKVFGMVNTAPGFSNTTGAVHGASELINTVFGINGQHARSAVGMVIPFTYAAEVELIAEVK